MIKQNEGDVSGWVYALLAYGWWGFIFPLVLIGLNALAEPAEDARVAWSLEILASRIFWCVLFCIGYIHLSRRWPQFFAAVRAKRVMLIIALASFLITCNWFGFILGASLGELRQASLGYYINPLLNVVLGYFFLGETLRQKQVWAVVLAAVGVIWLVVVHGEVPWIALLVACTFGFYGLVKKKLDVDPLVSLTLEAMYCFPFCFGYLLVRQIRGPALEGLEGDMSVFLALVFCGPATALPLIWFAAAARRLRLSTMGFIQFVAPTGQLLVALLVNNETLTTSHLIGFIFIWSGVIIYLWDVGRAASMPVKAAKDEENDHRDDRDRGE